ncbi:MAG TPA: protein kinase [bacterium]|nr:protein kinase [bacterium]
MLIEPFLQNHILSLQTLATGTATHLRDVQTVTGYYRAGLEAAGLPTRPLDEMCELMAPARDEVVPERIAAQAVIAVLSRHGLFPGLGESLPDFFGRLLPLRESLRNPARFVGSPGSVARLFLKPCEFLKISSRNLGGFPTYDKIHRISTTGNSMVYRAEDELDGHPVALKVYTSPDRDSSLPLWIVLNEIRFQANPSSDGVVQAYGTGRIPMGAPFVSFEWMPSEDLRGIDSYYHPKRNPIALESAVSLARQLIAPLAAIHAEGIVHRDVKPSNFVMDAKASRIKLTDFSLAVRMEEVRPETAPVGTSGFIPHEAYQAEYVDGPRRDVYALGMTMLDFFGRTLPARLRSRVGHQTPAEQSTLKELRRIVGRAIDGKPHRRYADAVAMIGDFDRL